MKLKPKNRIATLAATRLLNHSCDRVRCFADLHAGGVEVRPEFHSLILQRRTESHREGAICMQANKRTLGGALAAILTAPVTIVAALSGNIAPHLGISQGVLLIGDAVAAAIVFFALIAMK